eukprot:a347986_59.p1 GENE.a347986_59~~a347986_59.p1  ORF type:complete len:248 (-),score=96.74 a347986_59:204-893(-)
MAARSAVVGSAKVRSTATDWSGSWDPDTAFNTAGPGVFIEGVIRQVRYHSVTASDNVHRFLAVHVEVKLARKRNFDAHGTEVEPRMIGMKRLRTGYLTYQKIDAADPDVVLPDELVDVCGCGSGRPLPPGLNDAAYPELHPNVAATFEFWGDSDMLRPLDLQPGQEVKLRTKNNSFILHSLSKSDMRAAGYSGGNLMGGFGAKISSKQEDDDAKLPGEDKEGVAEDEWD